MTNEQPYEIFGRHADAYDAARRRLIPPYDLFYGTALDALELAGAPLERVLDLGAGTGLLAGAVRERHPAARLTLVDGSAAMLAQAAERLGSDGATSLRESDLRDPLPVGPWDAIVSALAIHHLEDVAKRRLFGRVRDRLRHGGVFVNAEQVSGPSRLLDGLYANWHERRARAAGSSDEEWAGALERMAHDRCRDVETQLGWLRDAGLCDADCLFKDHRFAVLVARRPA